MRTIKNIVTIVLSILIVSCEKEEIKFSQTNAKIIFISHRVVGSSAWYLMIMNHDGTEQNKITDMEVNCDKPVISNSGEKVLFVRYTENFFYELYFINIDGTNLTLVDTSRTYCGGADWSIDDTRIIYSKCRNRSTQENDIILYDIITEKKDTLTTKMDNRLAKFSPLNNKIAYCQLGDTSSGIYLMDIDGSNKQKIIPHATYPVWSPDAKKMAYILNGDQRSPQIYVANCDGSSTKQLTKTYLPGWDSGFPAFGNYNPQWTPDGNKIVYESEINDGSPEIYLMNQDGSNQIRLTTEGSNSSPEISRDGKFIVFVSDRDLDYNRDIFVMDIDGNNQYPLSKYYSDDYFPVLISK